MRLGVVCLCAVSLLGCAESTVVDAGPPPRFDAGPARMPSVDGGIDAGPECVQSRITTYWNTGAETILAWEGQEIGSRRPLRFRAGYTYGGRPADPDAGVEVEPGRVTFSAGSGLYQWGPRDAGLPWAAVRGTRDEVSFSQFGVMLADDGRELVADALLLQGGAQVGLFGPEVRRLRRGRFTFDEPGIPIRADVSPAVPFQPRNISALPALSFVFAYTEDGQILTETLGAFGTDDLGLSTLRWCEDWGGERAVIRAAVVIGSVRPSYLPSGAAWPVEYGAEFWVERSPEEGGPAVPHLARIRREADPSCLQDPVRLTRPLAAEESGTSPVDVSQPRVFMAVPLLDSGNVVPTLVVVEDGACVEEGG